MGNEEEKAVEINGQDLIREFNALAESEAGRATGHRPVNKFASLAVGQQRLERLKSSVKAWNDGQRDAGVQERKARRIEARAPEPEPEPPKAEKKARSKKEPKKKAEKAEKKKAEKTTEFDPTQVITVLSKENPKRGKSAERFEQYYKLAKGSTVADYIALNAKNGYTAKKAMDDLIWDEHHGFISIT